MDCSFRNVEGVGKALKDPKISPPNKERINQQLMLNLPLYCMSTQEHQTEKHEVAGSNPHRTTNLITLLLSPTPSYGNSTGK